MYINCMCDHIGYDDDYYLDRGEKKKCQSHVWYELCLYNSCMMMMMMNRATGYCGQKKYEIFAFHIMCACVFFHLIVITLIDSILD